MHFRHEFYWFRIAIISDCQLLNNSNDIRSVDSLSLKNTGLLILYPLKIHLCQFLGANLQVILMILIAVNFWLDIPPLFRWSIVAMKVKETSCLREIVFFFLKKKRKLTNHTEMRYGIRWLKLKLILILFPVYLWPYTSILILSVRDFLPEHKTVIVDPARPTKKAKPVIQRIFFDEHTLIMYPGEEFIFLSK